MHRRAFSGCVGANATEHHQVGGGMVHVFCLESELMVVMLILVDTWWLCCWRCLYNLVTPRMVGVPDRNIHLLLRPIE